jgi:hypothetical protein
MTKIQKRSEINFINIKIASYNIPMGALIPENTENFLVAEKNISVSNIVNGTTRLAACRFWNWPGSGRTGGISD